MYTLCHYVYTMSPCIHREFPKERDLLTPRWPRPCPCLCASGLSAGPLGLGTQQVQSPVYAIARSLPGGGGEAAKNRRSEGGGMFPTESILSQQDLAHATKEEPLGDR